ncbi:RNA-binding protein [Mesorhizobium caraganae]|uniref:RNA-binding protein n=1 Tax=Mesorhizobium caraganae TaxID=483206 RepID=UPI00333D586C
MPFTKYSSIFLPADLETMRKIFELLCQERHLALNDAGQREDLASEVMDAFQNGFTDEATLWEALSKRRTPGTV